jgi:hypothetical protein
MRPPIKLKLHVFKWQSGFEEVIINSGSNIHNIRKDCHNGT